MFRVLFLAFCGLAASVTLAGDNDIAPGGDLAPRGVVRATEKATLAIEFAAFVSKVHFREGDTFARGDRLIDFDCRRQRAEYDSARAQHREMELTLESNLYLRQRGAAGKHDIEISRTRMAKAAAEAEALRLRLDQCQIDAPFSGSVVDLTIHEHEMPAPGKPFLEIIKTGSLEIELIVPSNWLVWLREGESFSFQLEETAKTYPARVKRIAKAVDPVSQTVKIFGVFDNAESVLAGMSGTALFGRAGG